MATEKDTSVPSAPVTLDPNLIAAIVAAVAQQLKGTAAPPLDMEELGETIGSAVASGIEKNTRKKVTYGEYNQRGHSSFHPRPKSETPVLKRQCFENDARMNPVTLFDEEINLLNKITHSGRYCNRMVEVIVSQDGSEEALYIRYHNSTPDQRFELKGQCRDLIDMLKQITTAQAVERAEHEQQEAEKKQRRGPGYNKAYLEAKERADAADAR